MDNFFGNDRKNEEKNLENDFESTEAKEAKTAASEQPATSDVQNNYTWQQASPPPPTNNEGEQPLNGQQGSSSYPYNNYPYTQNNSYPYNRPPINSENRYGGGAPPPPTKKPGAGSKVLAVFVAIAILIAGAGIGYSLNFGGKPIGESSTNEDFTGINDGPTINFNQTPSPDSTTSPSGEFGPSDVYQKIKETSVGLLVYSDKSQNVYTEGSGVILGEDENNEYTYIITCAHVISDANIYVRVQMHDATEYEAEIVGYDERTDTGVVRIKATGLKAAEFGDSDLVQVGQTVYAIGNPGGIEFAGSFTSGMVSALDRPISSSQSSYTMECIQHQAAINPGNSGGALVNAFGQVVGINSAKLVAGYEGMGFAVPSKVFKPVVEQIIANGYVPNRPKLGITYAPASAFRTYFVVLQIKELPAGSIVIQGITNDSSLVDTDIKVNDMIVAVNGEDLITTDQLPALIEKSKVGDKLRLKIVRVAEDYTLTEFEETVTLVEDKGTAGFAEEATGEQEDPFEEFSFPFDFP